MSLRSAFFQPDGGKTGRHRTVNLSVCDFSKIGNASIGNFCLFFTMRAERAAWPERFWRHGGYFNSWCRLAHSGCFSQNLLQSTQCFHYSTPARVVQANCRCSGHYLQSSDIQSNQPCQRGISHLLTLPRLSHGSTSRCAFSTNADANSGGLVSLKRPTAKSGTGICKESCQNMAQKLPPSQCQHHQRP